MTPNVAWRNLSRERARLFVSVSAVAFSVMLIMVLRGVYSGFLDEATVYIRSVDTDLWVAEADTPGDLFHSLSLLPDDIGDDIGAIDGVEPVASLVAGEAPFVSYHLVSVDDAVDPAAVSAALRAVVPGTNPLSVDEFADRDTADLREGLLPIVWVLVVVAFVIGVAVIGLTIYTATLEKRQEYGVLKAIGFSNARLYGIVVQQSMAAGLLGLIIGVAGAVGLAWLLEQLIPTFVTSFEWSDLALVAVASVVMSTLASVIPARRIARVDPASVFRV